MKMMLLFCFRIILFVPLFVITTDTYAQHLKPANNSNVEFRVYNHKNGNDLARGLFPITKGNIFFDPKQLSKSSFDVVINAADISTSNKEVNKSLESKLFLSAATYPEIKIKSTSITSDGNVIYILHGTLTLKGITKPVDIQFTATPMGTGYMFRGSFRINRLTYNVGEKGDIDDMVTLFIELRTERVK
jgi:polyisoprenoid-binding protein YceI